MRNDWYRNILWDEEIASAFEKRLKRSRFSSNKAQYLRIQALYLLESDEYAGEGIILMNRLFQEFPDESVSLLTGRVELGDYYRRVGVLENAVKQYYKALTIISENKQYRVDELMILVKIIDVTMRLGKIVSRRLKNKILNLKTGLLFNNEKYYYNLIMARLASQSGDKIQSGKFAEVALELSIINKPQFYRHKNTGLVKASPEEITELQSLVNSSGSELKR